jgi:hypothetical protein
MTLSDGARVWLGGKRLRLASQDLVGEGGEGRVYRHGSDVAVKVFAHPNDARAAKLRAFATLTLPPAVVAPLELANDEHGDVVGYSMRLLRDAHDLQRFSQRKWRAGRATNADVIGVMRSLAKTVDRLHAQNVVVGDLNDGNVVVTGTTPWLIDADSMHLPGHPCVVAHERFLDPRFYGRDLTRGGVFTRETDWYALAVMAFSSLLYVHPFGGAHPAQPTLLRRAEARLSALRSDVKLPAFAAKPEILGDDALAWFERVFERDAREPLPSSILEARFSICSCGAEHARARCPACTLRANVSPVVRSCGKLRATRVFYKSHARVVTATYDGTLRWVADEDGALRREDETVVTTDRAVDFVRIIGNATWVAAGGVLRKHVAGRVVEEHAARGDAGPAGAILVQGDALVRAESATRAGQVLAGQTHVRVGATLGFAFYRAGGLTVAFVFDPVRGALRQVEGFPSLAGKLQGWSAVFGDDHVLVTFALERSGSLTHRAVLVAANGRIVAADESVLPPSLTGRAIGPGGSVLAASRDGLVLLRPERGDLVSARLFPEAKDFVSPEDDLLVGSGGTLYAVTDDEITHLCFTNQA